MNWRYKALSRSKRKKKRKIRRRLVIYERAYKGGKIVWWECGKARKRKDTRKTVKVMRGNLAISEALVDFTHRGKWGENFTV